MSPFKRIAILLLIIGAIISVGKLVPKKTALPGNLKQLFKKITKIKVDSTERRQEEKDTVETRPAGDWRKALLDSLCNKYSITTKKKIRERNGFWEITLPRGVPMVEYALELTRICRHYKTKIVRGRRLSTRNARIVYDLENYGESFQLHIRHGSSVLPGRYKIAIIFTQLDSLGREDFERLAKTSWKKSLVVNPVSGNEKLLVFANRVSRDEILIALPMEPFHYPYKNPGQGALFIHHSQKEVDKLLKEKLAVLPASAGFSSLYGDRAIENKNLLANIFRFCHQKSLGFLDLTGSQRSLSIQTAREHQVLCRYGREIKPSTNVADRLSKKIISAGRYGESILVAAYSRAGLRSLNRYIKKTNLKKEGIVLVNFSELDIY
ncbi:divergent polysaccharide deacetylase family protein [Fibrobacterota bacterium]